MIPGKAAISSMESSTYRLRSRWHGSCDSADAGGRGAVAAYFTPASGRRHFMLTQLTHDFATMSRRRALAATAGLVLGLAAFAPAKAADDTIKVGVLHSLSGTMAISETTLKDTILFL